jgi:N-acylneuraminate cytidylyltransferase/CMP-N,N'-diacetyllegionaminic acid synthase
MRICTVCARGGSKGVENKNLRPLLGKPLLAHSLEQARASGLFAALAVSSDSEEILETARRWGADYLIRRPDEMATDAAPKIPVIRHCLQESERQAGRSFDVIVDLDVTSPLRTSQDIRAAVAMLEESDAANVITAMPSRRSPYFNMVEVDGSGVPRLSKPLPNRIVRRQDAPQCYDMNASIYVWRRSVLMTSDILFHDSTRLYEMPEERSWDIDSEFDFQVVECLARLGGDPANG